MDWVQGFDGKVTDHCAVLDKVPIRVPSPLVWIMQLEDYSTCRCFRINSQ